MKVYDISREVFSARFYPGDPEPRTTPVYRLEQGDPCNVTALSLGSHTGTHMDAPSHFVPGGKTIDQVELSRCVGPCQVAEAHGPLSAQWVEERLRLGPPRLLVKGQGEVTLEAAEKMGELGLLLLGVEDYTVGTTRTGPQVHRALLTKEVAILEALDLSQVEPGEYLLAAQPLKYGGLDGAQVRPVLLDLQ